MQSENENERHDRNDHTGEEGGTALLEQSVSDWLATPTYREERQYLESHPALLSLTAEAILQNRITQAVIACDEMQARVRNLRDRLVTQQDDPQTQQYLQDARSSYAEKLHDLSRLRLALALLQNIQERAVSRSSTQAICEAYVNYHGGFALDVPYWLEQYRQQDVQLSQRRASHTQARARAAFWREALQQNTLDSSVTPEMLATVYHLLYEILSDIQGQDIAAIQQEEMAHLEAALRVFTRERYPYQWAVMQNLLGNVHRECTSGSIVAHQEQAIRCYMSALQVFTHEDFPVDWASVHNNLGVLYQESLLGDVTTNQEEAIASFTHALQVYTEDAFPLEWANLQINLGVAYQERFQGEPSVNQEQAISHSSNALRVFTEQGTPVDWAQAINNLGNIYQIRIRGEKAENQEAALRYYTAALGVLTEEDWPVDWAIIQNNLGAVYRERVSGEKLTNQQRAISCHNNALRVFTEHDYPADWARVQNNLGNVYQEHAGKDLASYQEQAIASYTSALRVFTENDFPTDWAMTQNNLGTVYTSRIRGDITTNLEQAIAFFSAALRIYTEEAFPADWAMTQNNLGVLYWGRVRESKEENLERALTCFTKALWVYTRAAFPTDWAMNQNNLGMVYVERIAGQRSDNLEQALTCFTSASEIYTRETFPQAWARTQNNLGLTYLERIQGERSENLEQAILCFNNALLFHTRAALPYEWAITQRNLGNAYVARVHGEKVSNQQQAIQCFTEALSIFTKESHPSEHRLTATYLAEVRAGRGEWQAAHDAYDTARRAEDMMLILSGGAKEQDAILRDGRDAAIRDAFVLALLGQVDGAILAIERGRARFLEAIRRVDAAAPEQIRDSVRRERYKKARDDLRAAQAALHRPLLPNQSENKHQQADLERLIVFQRAMAAFDAVLEDIRTVRDPENFLRDDLEIGTIYQASTHCGFGHALVYLLATPWGGLALVALAGNALRFTVDHCYALSLPDLTNGLLEALVEMKLSDSGHIVGGLVHAQENSGWEAIRGQNWPGETLSARVQTLHDACSAAGITSTLDMAAQVLFQLPSLGSLAERALADLSEEELHTLATAVNNVFLRLELSRCRAQLTRVLHRLVNQLEGEGVMELTLIPCGLLAAFPLLALPVRVADITSPDVPAVPSQSSPDVVLSQNAGQVFTWGDLFAASVAPSARSLLPGAASEIDRIGVYAIGNPRQARQSPFRSDLQWGEAEALHLVTLGGDRRRAAVQRKATRKWFLEKVCLASVFDAACHGNFSSADYLASALLLADGKVTLAEALNGVANLRGLRLLILSACQTAIVDLRGARDEVRSLAAGMLQAGARSVLAAHWPVDDRATYLLVVRFAQEWFPHMDWEPPAAALARAQQWLRSVTYNDLAAWETMLPLPKRTSSQETTSASTTNLTSVRGVGRMLNDPSLETIIAATESFVVTRHLPGEARQFIRNTAKRRVENLQGTERPYADPYFWAAFHITGW